MLKLFSRLHVFLYKISGGRIAGRFKAAPVLLLTTTGRKTGKRRTTPLLYGEDAGRYVVSFAPAMVTTFPSTLTVCRRERSAVRLSRRATSGRRPA